MCTHGSEEVHSRPTEENVGGMTEPAETSLGLARLLPAISDDTRWEIHMFTGETIMVRLSQHFLLLSLGSDSLFALESFEQPVCR